MKRGQTQPGLTKLQEYMDSEYKLPSRKTDKRPSETDVDSTGRAPDPPTKKPKFDSFAADVHHQVSHALASEAAALKKDNLSLTHENDKLKSKLRTLTKKLNSLNPKTTNQALKRKTAAAQMWKNKYFTLVKLRQNNARNTVHLKQELSDKKQEIKSLNKMLVLQERKHLRQQEQLANKHAEKFSQ